MKKRAFSLAEALVTLFVVFLVFGGASGLLSEYSGVLKLNSAHESYLVVAQAATQQMMAETRESMILEEPPATGWSAFLRFQRVDPAFASWLPPGFDPATSTPPGSWAARPPANMVRVEYRVTSTQLLRTATLITAGTSTTSVLASGVAGLQTRRLASGEIEIQVSVEDSQQVLKTITTRVLRPIR